MFKIIIKNITPVTIITSAKLKIVKYLIDHGADIHAYRDEPIRNAIKNGHLNVISYLFDKGKFKVEQWMINLAKSSNHWDIIEYLKK